MRRVIIAGLLAAALWSPAARAGEAGDAVFAERGPWSVGEDGLHWSMRIDGPDSPGFLRIRDGSVQLHPIVDASDQAPALELVEKTDQRTRRIGPFPVSGGDPVLTFFLEQTTRDMASLTGGSPFYIRNRIRDALVEGGDMTRDGGTASASFRPFATDPNAGRMRGFDTLTLTFVMSDPHAPIRELRAETSGGPSPYSYRMALQ